MPWQWQMVMGDLSPASLRQLLNQRMKALAETLREIEERSSGVTTLRDGDTSPSVAAGAVFLTANTAACTIAGFDEGRPGQRIVLVFQDALTTIEHGGDLQMNGDADFTGEVGDVKEFLTPDGVTWYDTDRPTTWS